MPAESRPHQVAAHCGDPKALVRFSDRGQQSGNQPRARRTRRVPVEQEQRPRNRDDCVVPGAGLRDNIIAGPILMPVYVYVPLKHETLLDLGVIMLGAGSCRFHAEQTNTLAGGRVEESFVYFAAYLAGRGGDGLAAADIITPPLRNRRKPPARLAAVSGNRRSARC